MTADHGHLPILDLHTYATDLNKIREPLDFTITEQYSAIALQYHYTTIAVPLAYFYIS